MRSLSPLFDQLPAKHDARLEPPADAVDPKRMLKTMRQIQNIGVLFILAAVMLGSWACRTVPSGDWHIEAGRASIVDDQGARRTRVEAAEDAMRAAQLKILRHVKALQIDNNLVADSMQQDAVVGVRIRSLILSAREFSRQYFENETVEVQMGVNLDDVRRVVRQPSR